MFTRNYDGTASIFNNFYLYSNNIKKSRSTVKELQLAAILVFSENKVPVNKLVGLYMIVQGCQDVQLHTN